MAVTNWAKNVVIDAERIEKPKSIDEVAATVREAIGSARRVRAVGGRWSFTDCMTTHDVLVETRALRGILGFCHQGRTWTHTMVDGTTPAGAWIRLLDGALKPSVKAADRRLAHVLAGTNIRELYLALDSPDGYSSSSDGGAMRFGDDAPGRGAWMLATKVGLSGQTIAGALSTASHGGDFDLPPIADDVRAIQLIDAEGEIRWLERSGGAGITQPQALTGAPFNLRAERVHYDDELFDAALVGVGALGIVVSVVLEVLPQYGMSERSFDTTWRDIRGSLESGEIFESTRYSDSDPTKLWIEGHEARPDRTPRGLGLAINLSRLSDDYSAADQAPDRKCRLSTQCTSQHIDGEHQWQDAENLDLRFMGLIHEFESGDQAGARRAIDTFLELWSSLEGTKGKYRKSYTVWDPEKVWKLGEFPDRKLFLSQEIAVSTEGGNHVHCIDALLEEFDAVMRAEWAAGRRAKFGGAIFLRFTQASRAKLGMQYSPNPSERFCYIEVLVAKEIDLLGGVHSGHYNMENVTERWLDRFEQVAHRYGGRMHWGQVHRLDRALVERGYRDALFAWRRAATRLASTRGPTFSNDFCSRFGLVPNTEVVAAVSDQPDRAHVFSFDPSGELLQASWKGGWSWNVLPNGLPDGARLVGALSACATGPDEIHVFARSSAGSLAEISFEGAWSWKDLAAELGALDDLGPIAACATTGSRVDVFGVEADGRVRQMTRENGWKETTLQSAFPGEDRFSGSITAIATGGGAVSVFGLGMSGDLLELALDANAQPSWMSHGALTRDAAGPITGMAANDHELELFALTKRRNVLHLHRGPNGWAALERRNELTTHVRKVGRLEDFGERAGTDELYKYEERRCTPERLRGPLSAVSLDGKHLVVGLGESGDLVELRRTAEGTRWTRIGNRWLRRDDELLNALVVELTTGSDDLRTDSIVHLVMDVRHGPSHAMRVQRERTWEAGSQHTIEWRLPAGIPLDEVTRFGLRFDSPAQNIGADNWDLRAVDVHFVGVTRWGPLLHACGDPLWRFSQNENQVWSTLVLR